MSTRAFGPFEIAIDAQDQLVAVVLTYAGQELWQARFEPSAPTATVKVSGDMGASASGTLTLQFGPVGSSQLQAEELCLQAPGYETTFTGTVAYW